MTDSATTSAHHTPSHADTSNATPDVTRRFRKPSVIVGTILTALLLAACSAGPDTNGASSTGEDSPATADQESTDVGDTADASCAATDARLPDAPDRELVAMVPVPDGLTDAGDTFDLSVGSAISGHTNTDVDPEAAVACIDTLVDQLGWDVVHRSKEGNINTRNGHAVVATHPDLPNLCLNASLFASAHTSVVMGNNGARMELSIRELSEGMVCNF